MDGIEEFVRQLLGGSPLASLATSGLITGLVALVVVVQADVWRISRNVVTIAHEGGHAVIALCSGRSLSGIRLHSDTSGLTVSRGKSTGPGMVFTLLAGYPAPCLLGLAGSWLVATGRNAAMLWIAIGLLAAMLLAIRNAYGVLSLVVTGGVLFAVSWFASAEVRAMFCQFLVWFLLFAGVRPIGELSGKRRRGRAGDSDADQLARLTRVPAGLWLTLWMVFALGCVLLGGRWLLLASA